MQSGVEHAKRSRAANHEIGATRRARLKGLGRQVKVRWPHHNRVKRVDCRFFFFTGEPWTSAMIHGQARRLAVNDAVVQVFL